MPAVDWAKTEPKKKPRDKGRERRSPMRDITPRIVMIISTVGSTFATVAGTLYWASSNISTEEYILLWIWMTVAWIAAVLVMKLDPWPGRG